ncbi:MAG: Ig-like domain-containing protein [Lachnospiraceae bacterium]|nr:Ig-like domain-containing protein [Lachnospiraceae bacterium]
MFDSLRKRLMCGFVATAVAFGSFAFPSVVMADDDDDYDFMVDLVDITPEENEFLNKLTDEDDDEDIDEDDIKAAITLGLVGAMIDEENEQQRKREEEQRQQAALDAQRAATLEAQRKAEQEAIKRAELEKQLKAEKEKNKYKVTGVGVSTTYVTLQPGQTYQVIAYVMPDSARNKRVYFSSSNPSVATVDGSGIIKANGAGNAVITVTTDESGYKAFTTVDVNHAPAVVAQTASQDANWTTIAAGMIVSAVPGQTLNLVAPKALSIDAGMINALKARPDVGLLIAYPYNGHTYAVAIPAGYNLAALMDKSGKVSLIKLAAVKDGKILTTMVM